MSLLYFVVRVQRKFTFAISSPDEFLVNIYIAYYRSIHLCYIILPRCGKDALGFSSLICCVICTVINSAKHLFVVKCLGKNYMLQVCE